VMETLGYAGAANLGAAAARGDHIVFVDYDIVFTKGWLAALLATHLSSATIGATGCCIVDPHSGRVLDFGIGFTRFNSPHPHMDHRVGSPLVSRSRPVQALCTAAFVITKELFIEVGGFDPVFASLYTDIDLCLRLKAIGRECWVSASAIVYHFGGDTSLLDRSHRAHFLKADVKAWFRATHVNGIAIDMDRYYEESWDVARLNGLSVAEEYVACCLINVADPEWYVDVMKRHVRIVDVTRLPTGTRDAAAEPLYVALGYDFLKLRAPIIYFVDRFISVVDNALWWERRADLRDFVVDRHGNVASLSDVMAVKDR